MTNKDLLLQLKTLKNLEINSTWNRNHREILATQISNSRIIKENKFSLRKLFSSIGETIAQPSFVLSSICLIALGAVGVRAAYTRPGDSFYIAKIISEKTQLAITFDQDKKIKKEINFANNRAQEITQVIASSQNETKNTQLKADFKKEIGLVRTKITNISSQPANQPNEDEVMVYTADSGKDENGIQISEPADTQAQATTTPAIDAPQQLLEEAESLFDNNDYMGAENKLKEVGNIINQENTESQPEAPTDEATSSETK
jgi:hypothetical protein